MEASLNQAVRLHGAADGVDAAIGDDPMNVQAHCLRTRSAEVADSSGCYCPPFADGTASPPRLPIAKPIVMVVVVVVVAVMESV
jgi:hypothetical protein